MRMQRMNNREEDKVKWGKIISFLVAILLLGIAIAISMTNEKKVSEASYNSIKSAENNTSIIQTEQASTELSKSINQVMGINQIQENKKSEIEEKNINKTKVNTIENTLVTSTNEAKIENKVVVEEKKEVNETDNKGEDTIVKPEFIFPVEGEVIKEFAKDNLIYSETLEEWITHNGIDIKADKATIVKAVADGTVKSIKNDPRYGLTVTIEHTNGYISSYSSLLTAEFVKEGEKVTQGQTIGTVGNSAVFEVSEDNHLHFELIKDGSNINPEIYLK